MRQYMEGSVTAEQLQEYVVRYNLKDHFEKLKQIDFSPNFFFCLIRRQTISPIKIS